MWRHLFLSVRSIKKHVLCVLFVSDINENNQTSNNVLNRNWYIYQLLNDKPMLMKK